MTTASLDHRGDEAHHRPVICDRPSPRRVARVGVHPLGLFPAQAVAIAHRLDALGCGGVLTRKRRELGRQDRRIEGAVAPRCR